MKHEESNIPVWKEHFKNRIWSPTLTFYNRDIFVMFVLGSVYPKPNLLVIWDFMRAKIWRLVLHKSLCSYLQVTHVNSVTKYEDLLQVWEFLWGCTSFTLMEMAANSLARHAIRFSRIFLLHVLPRVLLANREDGLLQKKWQSPHTHTHTHIYIYIYIYMCVCVTDQS